MLTFSKLTCSKDYFSEIIRESNGLDPGQNRQNVHPDLGPNCLQRLSVTKIAASIRKELKLKNTLSSSSGVNAMYQPVQ